MGKWEMVQIGDVCEILNNKRVPVTASERKKGIYPYYGANGIQDYVDNYIFDDELVLLAEDGGHFGSKERPIAYRVSGKCWVNNHAHVLKPKHMLDVDYLCYSIMFYDVSNLISGTTRAKLNQAAMRKMTIPLPPMDVQKKIADVLDQATDLIEKRKEQIAKLDLLVKAKFVDMFGDPALNPFGWRVAKLGDVIVDSPQNGLYKPSSFYTTDGTGTPILRIDAFYSGKLVNITSFKRLVCTPAEIETYGLHKNDIVVNRVNSMEYLGKCALITGLEEQTVFESNMMRFRVNPENINAQFIVTFLCSPYVYTQIVSHAKKAVNQASINQTDVQNFGVYVPPLELQQQFADFVWQTEKSKSQMQQELNKLELLYKSLMQKCFFGEDFK